MSLTQHTSAAPGRSRLRTARGQTILGGVAFLVMLVMVFVGLLLMYVNTVVITQYKYKIQVAAGEAARLYDDQHYFLGQVRRDFNQDRATQAARQLADFILTGSGMPPSDTFDVGTTALTTATGNRQLTTVIIGEKGLPTFGSVLPLLSISSTGVSLNGSAPAYGIAQISFVPTGGSLRSVYVPCYGVFPDPTGNFNPVGAKHPNNSYNPRWPDCWQMPTHYAGLTEFPTQDATCPPPKYQVYPTGQTIDPWLDTTNQELQRD